MNISKLIGRDSQKIRKAQDDWLLAEFETSWMENVDAWVNEDRKRNAESYVNQWIELCAKAPTTIRVTNSYGIFDALTKRLPDADRFGIVIDTNKSPIKLAGKMIDLFRSSGNGKIALENCAVRELDLRSPSRKVILRNCRIGLLRLDEGSIGTFEMIGGSIDRIIAPAPYDKSPFTGSAEIRDVRLSSAFGNAQAYRNLRHHLSALHNHEAASVFHAAEMQAEVKRQSFVDQGVGALYRALSNYGGSSARPFGLFLLFILCNFLFLLFTDGTVVVSDSQEAEGWRVELCGSDQDARILRAAVFALNQCFNPLGIFGARLFLSAKSSWIAGVSLLFGIASALSLTLFVLAIRRRFRLDRSG